MAMFPTSPKGTAKAKKAQKSCEIWVGKLCALRQNRLATANNEDLPQHKRYEALADAENYAYEYTDWFLENTKKVNARKALNKFCTKNHDWNEANGLPMPVRRGRDYRHRSGGA